MQEIAYQVVRSNRKSVALVIDNEANLIVRAPLQMQDATIEEFVRKKKRWINEKQQQVAVFGEKHPPVVVETGESLMYLGSIYAIIKDAVDTVHVSGNELFVPNEYGIAEMTEWMKSEAMRVIAERVSNYAGIMGVTPGEIKLSEAKARWGSCSTKNNLNFAWRLIMCPLSVIDYVVVHELSHITYKNHSPAFWARVKTVLPNYEDDQDWLKVNKKLMEII
ncbi:MAG TPA: M48 family metallopeptidase [Candidatus Eisenbergiella merdavium]|uniref:M48 family metallopeptidase n=1 Tax=Candidatus Eisenbergiella merdavium TaxID=2838551 RepID=A0A9D2NEM2_9FIRM|nr:M48 family metallopeptidase [Candidatus Eisenbergiella merdavium]